MFVKTFSQINKSDAAIAGGKGSSLGEMTRMGFPVPPGFVVLAGAFDRFLTETDLGIEIEAVFSKVNQHDIASVEFASEKIQSLILSAEMPSDIKDEIESGFRVLNCEFVAVRSSATAEDSSVASWAGELESYLNTTHETLLDAVKKCWASLFTPRAIFYRYEKEMHKDYVAVAVVVQKMVQSEVSGITFTVHPVTEDYNQMVIEAGYGLGEAIVGGMITPDTYVIDKANLSIEDKNISQQEMMILRSPEGNEEKLVEIEKQELQKISDDKILELAKICLSIEKHYGFPCDIEWAHENEKFYIVQSRPITTLNIVLKKEGFNVGNYKNYQRLFQWRGGGLPFLISDIFMKHYSNLECLIIFSDEVWTNFLPKTVIGKTLDDGLDRMSSVEKFENYKKDFENYKIRCTKLLEEIIGNKNITKEELEAALNVFVELFFHYSKTEFFYIDKAFKYSKDDKTTKNNLKKFDEIKNEGRIFLNKLFFGHASYIERILEVLQEKFSVSSSELKSYSMKELVGLFEDKKIQKDIINERRIAFIMQVSGSDVVSIQGMEAASIANKFLHSEEKISGELRGVIANKGFVRGKVKIINSDYVNFNKIKKFIEEMEYGDILVADTTAPELIVACKKASAILTNQGGLMSHAAIVSRELGIPCIVGLNNITDIVEDGDVVEVDADNGIVRVN